MPEPGPGYRGGLSDPVGRDRIDRGSADHGVRHAAQVAPATTREVVDRLFREEQGQAVATLIRVLGDFDLAEEAVQEAFAMALQRWPGQGLPRNPAARSEEHTSELQSRPHLVCRLLLEKKKKSQSQQPVDLRLTKTKPPD